MRLEDNSNSQSGLPLLPQGEASHTQNSSNSQEAAAKIIRMQIDKIFDEQSNDSKTTSEPTEQNIATPIKNTNPYQRTHTQISPSQTKTNDWKEYHTAWQNYYQKYYEGYYSQQARNAQTKTDHQNQDSNSTKNETFTTKEAVFDLKQKLLGKIRTSAHKARKSRHFIPILSGLIVLFLFLFIQYNQLIISNIVSYISPGNIDQQNIVVDPSASVTVSADPKLIIPKINVDVPVIYDVGSDYNSQMAAMTKGVAHFAIPGANSHPGEVGNTVLAGHSSNDLFDTGDYKFIFVQLDKLVAGDIIYANYKSVRYTYVVTKKEVVKPTDVSKLVYNTDVPILTLVTCTPIGTATNRLLVTAEQISPDPTTATKTSATTSSETSNSMPGTTKTLLEKIFSIFSN